MDAQEKIYDTDRLETATASDIPDQDHTPNFPADSPTSARDAGLDDELLEETGNEDELIEDDLNEADSEFEGKRSIEIPMTDIDTEPEALASPEMSDMNVPGEVDIETLDEHALDDTDLPDDARLDPLED